MTTKTFGFSKQERLKSRKKIGRLFKERHTLAVYPLRVFWYAYPIEENSIYPAQVAFNVSKRTYKSAPKRNRYKRLMREAYRLHKHPLYDFLFEEGIQLDIMFLFLSKKTVPFDQIEKKFILLRDKLIKEVTPKRN